MDHGRTPVLEAIERYHSGDNYTFALPGHRFGCGLDDRTVAVLSRGAFEADVITANRRSPRPRNSSPTRSAARQAVFTTCGSSISIHVAMLTVTGPGKKILVDRNVHESVVASLILAGAEPIWLRVDRRLPSSDGSRGTATALRHVRR
jgi:arginine/lysine/ornithine decarboxylase